MSDDKYKYPYDKYSYTDFIAIAETYKSMFESSIKAVDIQADVRDEKFKKYVRTKNIKELIKK
jgi:hypothetical protein